MWEVFWWATTSIVNSDKSKLILLRYTLYFLDETSHAKKILAFIEV